MHLPRRRPRSRRILHHGHGRVPQPRHHGRVRDGAPRRQAVGDPDVRLTARRQDEPADRPLPHRGDRAVPRAPPHLRRRRLRHRVRPHLSLGVRTHLRAPTHPAPGRPHPPRRVPVRRRRHVGRRVAGRGRHDRGHTRSLHRDARSFLGYPTGGRSGAGRPAKRVHRHVVVLDPAALRRLRAAPHLGGGSRRLAQYQLRDARVSGGVRARARTAGLAAPRDPLPVGHAQPHRRLDRADEPRGQAVDARDRAADRHPAQRGLWVRRRSGLDTRPLEGRRLDRRFEVRPHRPGGDRSRRVLTLGSRRRA